MLYFTGPTWFDPGEHYIWYRSLCFVPVLSQLEENVVMALSSTHGKVVMTTSNPNPTNPTRALTPQFGSLSAHRPKDLSFAQLWIWGLTPTPITPYLATSNLKTEMKWWKATPFCKYSCNTLLYMLPSCVGRPFCPPSITQSLFVNIHSFNIFLQFSIFSVLCFEESFFLNWAGAVLFPLYRPIRETNGGKRFFTARAPC